MDHDNEKVRDIVAEMREHGDRITNGGVMADGADLRDYAARIEAAAKREMGDAAKLRKALEHCLDAMCDMCANRRNCEIWDKCPDSVGEGFGRCEEFLAARAVLTTPPRNCDVGTAEERARRWAQHCDTYLRDDGSKPCTGCSCCGKVLFGKCEFAWAQMPYEADAGQEGGAV